MTKKVLFIALGFVMTLELFAQKPQRIAFIDMEYILENIPDYQTAQSQLNQKVTKWQENIAEKQRELDQMKSNLSNEKALLTKDLIEEREEDITIKTDELRTLQNKYFGTNGDLFMLRQQLVKPIQDQVFNAIQEIAVNRQYDFVLDKSSDLIMLYSNEKYDISDMVVKSITRTEKQNDLREKQAEAKGNKVEGEQILTEAQEERQEALEAQKTEQETKKKELQDKIEAQKAERAKQREDQLKAIEEARQKKLLEREEARKKLEEKKAADQKAREEKQKQG